jgi:2-C-methyl-D-erythritol 4-phosphate cytidylyltransferase
MKVYAILTAAGTGSRYYKHNKNTSQLPKQFIEFQNKPVFLYSLLILQKCRFINDILITADEKYFDLIHKLASENRITKLTHLVEGGKTRFQSVRNAFRQIKADPSDMVLIHDAVRPNITLQFVNGIIESALKYGNVIPGINIRETVKKDRNGFVKETIERSNLWIIQTPQVFKFGDLTASYKVTKGRTDFTDESSMVENAGYKVKLAEGFTGNIKITTPEDITLLKKLMS